MKSLAIAFTLAVTSAAFAADEVTVKPLSVVEMRVKEFIKEGVWTAHPGLELELHVEGAAINAATAWGKLKLDAATDDAGTDLKPKKDDRFGSPSEDDFESINRFGQDEKEKGFKVKLKFGLPVRSAKKIKEVKGEFQVLAGGEEKVIEVKDLLSQRGKTIEDPALKAAELEFKFVAPKADEKSSAELPVELKGDPNNLKEVEILDAAGEKVSNGYMSSGFGGKQSISYSLMKPLDEKMTMKIHVLIGQKSVTVPVDLKDLDLP